MNFLVKVRVSTTLARRLCYFIKHMELVLGGFLFIFRHIFGLNTAVYMKYLLISRESYRKLAFCKIWDGTERKSVIFVIPVQSNPAHTSPVHCLSIVMLSTMYFSLTGALDQNFWSDKTSVLIWFQTISIFVFPKRFTVARLVL